MVQVQVYEGSLEQLAQKLRQLPKARKYRMTVVLEETETLQEQPKLIAFGMFPQLQSLTEEDFSVAEGASKPETALTQILPLLGDAGQAKREPNAD